MTNVEGQNFIFKGSRIFIPCLQIEIHISLSVNPFLIFGKSSKITFEILVFGVKISVSVFQFWVPIFFISGKRTASLLFPTFKQVSKQVFIPQEHI